MSGKIFVISAPSGTGKTTLVNELLNQWKGVHSLKRGVTYTTRQARSGEREGKEYYFVTREDFEKKREEGFFLEWSSFCGNLYGSPISLFREIATSDVSFILILDRHGGAALKDIPEVVLIWIAPPSVEELVKRLAKRGEDSFEDQQKRLQMAEQEMNDERKHHLYQYHVVNDNFFETVKALKKLIENAIDEKT